MINFTGFSIVESLKVGLSDSFFRFSMFDAKLRSFEYRCREEIMQKYKKLTLLHSNDIHGDFMPEIIHDRRIGGMGLLSGYIDRVRNEEKNVIYAIAGDVFRGSVIDTEYKGISTVNILNALSPDIMTLGNHEIDYGIAHLLFIEKCAKFPIVNANIYIKHLDTRLFMPYKIMEMDGMKLLFIGVVTDAVMDKAKDDEIGEYIYVTDAAREVEKICNAYHSTDIDLTVLLTHIGIDKDKELAMSLDASCGVDLILGGHTHTLMTQPIVVNGIPIVHAHMGTNDIGRFDLVIDTEHNCMKSYTWNLVPIDENCAKKDEIIEEMLARYKDVTDEKYERVLTRFPRKLTHPARNIETELGNLFADILRESLGIDIMFLASGSVRSRELGPVITYGLFLECFPFDDAVYLLHVTGRQLHAMITYMQRDEAFEGHTEYYQFSRGMEILYSAKEKRLLKLKWMGEEIANNEERLYSVGMQQYHYLNFESNFNVPIDEVRKNRKIRKMASSCQDILEEYLSSHTGITANVEGRNVVIS